MLWQSAEHEQLSDRPWDEELIHQAMARIVADAMDAEHGGVWPGHPLDDLREQDQLSTLYLGSAGMIWALWKLGSELDASEAIAEAIGRYRARPDFGSEAHAPSLWMGEAGQLVVAHLVGSPAADPERLTRLIEQNSRHPTWELMWGSPGTTIAARVCGLQDAWVQSARLLLASWEESSDLWTQDLYGTVTQYLGPAHGFAGNVQALRGYVPGEVLAARVTRALERSALVQDGLVNWLPTVGGSPSKIRVQWCHGAPGIIATLGELIPWPLALGAGELIWRAGPLVKGPGLCHGTAGNGFAFLRLYELTGDELWLDRARRFAIHAVGQVEQHWAEFGRGRYSLWTGDIGVALYLRACLAQRSAFPMIDEF